ncbi:MAG: sulfatase-like hydrolase/transferase [Acidobacteriota bacterium]
MKRSIIIQILFLTIFSLLLQGRDKKNILLVTIDTIRYDRIGIYSKEFVRTPNIDRLAGKSSVFKRAFAHTPITLPSHANILTGTTPLYHGISDNNRFRLDDKFLTLAEHLKENGYKTAAFTASFVLNEYFKLNQGFDLYNGPEKSRQLTAEEIIKPSVKWIKNNKGPWFLWIHLWDPHTPYSPPEPFKTIYKSDLYSGEAAYTDSQLGIMFDYIENSGLMKNTSIIITGDHGEALGDHYELEHGYFAYNATIHIPLIIYDPALKNSSISNNVSHIDIFPTICNLARIGIPAHIQGKSLLPLMKGEQWEEEIIYFETKLAYYSRGWAPLEGFIKKDKKFINLPIKELYDLKRDFSEQRNIISGVSISELSATLATLISGLTGADRELSKKKISTEAKKKLKTLGYLSGVVQKKKSIFTKEDDLKVLLPVELKLLKARSLKKKGKYREAIEIFMEVKNQEPDNVSTYISLADIYHKTNRITAGLEIIEAGLSVNPSNKNLLLKKEILLKEDNKPDKE